MNVLSSGVIFLHGSQDGHGLEIDQDTSPRYFWFWMNFWPPSPLMTMLIGTKSDSIYVGQFSGYTRVIFMIHLA